MKGAAPRGGRSANWRRRLAPAIISLAASFFVFCFLLLPKFVSAEDFSSANFVDSNPVIIMQGGRSTSANFEVISGTSQNDIGESSSAGFGYKSGYFYFPLVTSPVVSATAGDSQAILAWSAAVGSLGINVSAYQVGQATNSNGPFSFTNVGNVLTSTRLGLANGTAYYFVVRALDFFGFPVATSSVVSATPAAGSSSGGPNSQYIGGSGSPESAGNAEIKGETAPNSTVTVLVDGVIRTTTRSDVNGAFTITLNNLITGSAIVSVYGTDNQGLKTAPVTVSLSIYPSQTTRISGILLSPTLTTDKESLPAGEYLTVSGQAAPNSVVSIFLEGQKNDTFEMPVGTDGKFSQIIKTVNFPDGPYRFTSRLKKRGINSPVSRPVSVTIGPPTKIRDQQTMVCPVTADFNKDCRVDLVDFSILMYWFNKTPPPLIDLNSDGTINIVDFSILMYFWTG